MHFKTFFENGRHFASFTWLFFCFHFELKHWNDLVKQMCIVLCSVSQQLPWSIHTDLDRPTLITWPLVQKENMRDVIVFPSKAVAEHKQDYCNWKLQYTISPLKLVEVADSYVFLIKVQCIVTNFLVSIYHKRSLFDLITLL